MGFLPMSQTPIVAQTKNAVSVPGTCLLEKVPPAVLQQISKYNTHTLQTALTAHLVSKALSPLFEKINLDLHDSNITDKDLYRIIKQYQGRLISLNLSNCPKITDAGLKYIAA